MKAKKTFSIFLSSIIIFSLFYLPSSFQIEVVAQGGLLTHQDTVNGFTVSYPANWNKQDNVYGTHGVQLSPNLAARDNVFIDVVQQPGTTLDSWTQEKIGSINSRQGASILQLNPTTLGSNPAYKVEYVWEGDKILEMWTVIGDKLFAISYVGEGEEKYQQNLPAVQSIIDSFQLTNAGSSQATSLATTTTATPTTPAKPNNDNNDNDKTYCDVPNPSNPCHDRKDGDEETGLYTCIDGSHEADWRDCTGGGSNDDDDDSHPQNDPDCWYGGLYVCDDESGECDNDEFDCMTDCADGSIVTTGEDCPGNDDSDEPASDDSWEDEPAAEEESGGYWEDDGYIDENGDGDYDEGEE